MFTGLLKKYQALAGPALTFEQVTYKNIARSLEFGTRAPYRLTRKIEIVKGIMSDSQGDKDLYSERLKAYQTALEEVNAELQGELVA